MTSEGQLTHEVQMTMNDMGYALKRASNKMSVTIHFVNGKKKAFITKARKDENTKN
jgi:hypothetical protein